MTKLRLRSILESNPDYHFEEAERKVDESTGKVYPDPEIVPEIATFTLGKFEGKYFLYQSGSERASIALTEGEGKDTKILAKFYLDVEGSKFMVKNREHGQINNLSKVKTIEKGLETLELLAEEFLSISGDM